MTAMRAAAGTMRMIALSALALWTAVAAAQDARVLIAAPHLEGFYSRTAVLVFATQGGHAGFILNRATDVTLAALFPDHAPSAKVADPVYVGGPDMTHALFAVVRGDPGGPSLRLFDELFVTADAQAVDRIIERTPNEARYFAGFVHWQPGELQSEVEAGFWYVDRPDPALLFGRDPGTMWEDLLRRLRTYRAS